jgi:hypothetical protein
VPDAIAEKEQALAAWGQLMQEFAALRSGLDPQGERAQQWLELWDTARYGDTWMRFACHHFIGCWQAWLWQVGERKDQALHDQALEHLSQSEAAWAEHVGEVAALPGVATPYAEHGFSQEREAVRVMLAGGPPPKMNAGGGEGR